MSAQNKMATLSRSHSLAQSETSGSVASDVSVPVPPDALHDMDDSSIVDLIQQADKLNRMMEKEVEIFETFLKRLDPKDTQVKPVASSQVEDKRKKSRQRTGIASERLLKLTVEQKYDIATRELDELREELVKKRQDNERVLDHHRAVMTGADHRLIEINKAVYEFDRDIIRGAVNARTGKIQGERVFKFFEDYLRSKDNVIEKLRLKNSTMRVKKQKLILQLKQKEEAGEVRHEVDFEQLKIENEQLRDRLEDKNKELLKLKLSSGNSMQVLNSYKQKVQGLRAQSNRLCTDIKQREQLVGKIDAEFEQSVQEKEAAEKSYRASKRLLEDYKVPEIMEYVSEMAGQHELKKTLKIWRRKVEIAEMTLHTYKQTWHQLCRQSQQKHSPMSTHQIGTHGANMRNY